ncbi:Ig domain-containing protein [Vibrio parahaemolyticus]|nr:Ig domain-containing protein [Vibrio parahaemolyticus]
MTQLFRNDAACSYFFEIMKVTKRENYIDDLVKMSKEAGESKVFGYALYDSSAFPQLSNLSRDFFAENYTAILAAMTSTGVFDSYILLIRQILGESTLIFHEIPNPGHLSLKVVKTESGVNRLATSNEMQLATSSELGILVSTPLSDYTVMQLAKTIEALCQPSGIYVDFNTIYPESVVVTPDDATVTSGDTVQYTAQVTYGDGTVDDRVIWGSSDISVATIDEYGLATSISGGDAVISASAIGVDSAIGYANLHVNEIAVVSVSINETIDHVNDGDFGTLTAAVTYSDSSVINSSDDASVVSWRTSDSSVITIDENGNYTVISAGSATITATSTEDTSIFDEVSVSPTTNDADIVLKVGYYEQSISWRVFGYRRASNSGEIISGSFPSGSAINSAYARDATYGMVLGSTSSGERWNDWNYITAKWKFEDGTEHVYAGRLLMSEEVGFYNSSVIDDELLALAESNLDKTAELTLSLAETPSNEIEIIIGQHRVVGYGYDYGFLSDESTGELVSGEFPDGSPVLRVYCGDGRYGCVVDAYSAKAEWNFLSEISVTWEFEDGTSYTFPKALKSHYTSGQKVSGYKSSYIDDTLVSIISTKIGQSAKVIVSEI